MLDRHRNRYQRVPSSQSPPTERRTPRRFILILIPILALLAVVIPFLLSLATGQSMRLCVPLNLNRVSNQLHRAVACSPLPSAAVLAATSPLITSTLATPVQTTTINSRVSSRPFSSVAPLATPSTSSSSNMSSSVTPGRLADWLLSQKEAFIGDLKAGRGKGWLVTMGNEAGGEYGRCSWDDEDVGARDPAAEGCQILVVERPGSRFARRRSCLRAVSATVGRVTR